MTETISAKELRAQLRTVVEKARRGARFTVLYRSKPAFDIVPVGNPDCSSVPLDSDSLFEAPPVGASGAGDAARTHDDTLYG